MTTDDLRIIGTGYAGKEPFEYTADVLRNIVRTFGVELGFENCLTSRPFTAMTHRSNRRGAMVFGRGDFDGADRATIDLTDGLDALGVAGFCVEEAELLDPGQMVPGRVSIAGPLLMPGRWAPLADRLAHGDVWRHVIIDSDVNSSTSESIVCLDPVTGGYTAFDRDILVQPGVTVYTAAPPTQPVDLVRLARICLVRGAGWRCAETGSNRDHRGIERAAAETTTFASGIRRRWRSSLAGYALHGLRAGALLGHCGPLTTDELALAELLSETVARCRAAQAAMASSHNALTRALVGLATTAEAVGELYARVASATE